MARDAFRTPDKVALALVRVASLVLPSSVALYVKFPDPTAKENMYDWRASY